jgi:hypothetical protein
MRTKAAFKNDSLSAGLVVEVVERRDSRGVWTVEAIGGDGEIYQALFAGPEAESRAREYSFMKYAR